MGPCPRPAATDRRAPPGPPAPLDAAIARALAKAPGDRYPSCEALVATAQAALAGTAPSPMRRRARRPARGRAGAGSRRPRASALARRPVLLLAAVAGLLAAVVLAAAVLIARDDPAAPPAAVVTSAANQAVRIDTADFHQAAVGVGTDPVAVTGGEGLVWVASRDGAVTVVDPATNQVQETLPASGSGPPVQGAAPASPRASLGGLDASGRSPRPSSTPTPSPSTWT